MKKVTFVFLAALLPASAFGQDPSIAARLDLAASPVAGLYAEPSIEVAWQPGLWGFGLRAESLVGLHFGDVYVASFFLVKIGRFDLGIGASLMLVPPAVSYAVDNPSLVLFLGITGDPLARLGPGTLRLDFSLSFLETAVEAGTGPLAPIGNAMNVGGGAFKVALGVAYVSGP